MPERPPRQTPGPLGGLHALRFLVIPCDSLELLRVKLGRHNIRQFPITSPRRTGQTKWHNRKRFPITSPRRTAFEPTSKWIVQAFWLQCASVSLQKTICFIIYNMFLQYALVLQVVS